MSAMPAEIIPAETGPVPMLPAQREASTAQRQAGAGPHRSGSRTRSTGARSRPAGVRACSAALRAEPVAALQPAPALRPAAPSAARAAGSVRPHLTARGRSALIAGAVIVATLLWFAVASATHGLARTVPPRAGGQAPAAQIVVQPGQTLWSIATQADPSADPRLVIQQIVSMNSLTSENIVAGQHLRVPQG
jgi:LysM repeat protein